jgi:hypothetical protein
VIANAPAPSASAPSRRRAGFSLVEILVVVALLIVIILGLVAMFSQTQRAFLSGTTQIDLLESGRTAADFVARDLEQMTPGYVDAPNFYSFPETGSTSPATPIPPCSEVITFAGPPPVYGIAVNPFTTVPPVFAPVIQAVPNDVQQWTNVLQSFYFLSRYNQQWNLVGYFVDRPDLGVGTLYRTNLTLSTLTNFAGAPGMTALNGSSILGNIVSDVAYVLQTSNSPYASTNYNRIADGVIHLRIRALDTNGIPITNLFPYSNPGLFGTIHTNIFITGLDTSTGDFYYSFFSNAVPAYFELEMGFLEQRALQQYDSLTNNPAAAYTYITNHLGQVHLFRQRIAIRNYDPSAYQ